MWGEARAPSVSPALLPGTPSVQAGPTSPDPDTVPCLSPTPAPLLLPRRLSLRLPSAPSTHYFSILSSLSSLNSWLSPSVPPLPGTFLGSLILVPRVSQGHSLDSWLFTWQMSVSACRMPQLHRMLGRQRGARHSPDPPGTPSLEGKCRHGSLGVLSPSDETYLPASFSASPGADLPWDPFAQVPAQRMMG